MSRVWIPHPSKPDIHFVAGHDHAVGPFFIEKFREGRDRPLKSLDMFTAGRAVTLQDILDFMIAEGVFTLDQLQEALAWIATDEDESWQPKRDVMRVVEIVEDEAGDRVAAFMVVWTICPPACREPSTW